MISLSLNQTDPSLIQVLLEKKMGGLQRGISSNIIMQEIAGSFLQLLSVFFLLVRRLYIKNVEYDGIDGSV